MGRSSSLNRSTTPVTGGSLTRITVGGYKSLSTEQQIEVTPLTILAGANSSGKSSMMQPLLLLKQTLDASFDPGALLLSGPNVRFTSVDQLFSWVGSDARSSAFHVAITLSAGETVCTSFRRGGEQPIEVYETSLVAEGREDVINVDRPFDGPEAGVPPGIPAAFGIPADIWREKAKWGVERDRCFLGAVLRLPDRPPGFGFSPGLTIEHIIRELIHLPGLRGNPERTYPVSAVGDTFPGTFEKYVASVIARWQDQKDKGRMGGLWNDLERLGMTWKVTAKRVSDTQVELQVGRLPRAERGGAYDLVSIADVGFGLSQVLPVVVALHTARRGQVVYVEQPELHLHPRAQVTMAEVLAEAATRGVRVIAETHSALLLLGTQSLVAEGKLPREIVKLHWFERDRKGATTVTSADLDERGAFGEWPEDFAEVALQAESRYLDAVEARHAQK
jgi:predicted ATPase